MKFKVKTRILAFTITLIMLMACVPVSVYAAQTTPLDYNAVADKALLYTVDFKSNNFTVSSGKYSKPQSIKNQTSVRNGTSLNVNYSNAVVDDANTKDIEGTDSRFIGYLSKYPLKSRTYTLDFDISTKTSGKRMKLCIGYGIYAGQTSEGPIFTEVNYGATLPFRSMRGASSLGDETSFANTKEFVKNGTQSSHFKVVLSGSNESSGKVTVTYAIYSKDLNGRDLIHRKGTFTAKSADAYVTLGVGNWDAFTNDKQYYEMSNVNVYRGDTADPFDFQFKKKYDEAPFGMEMLKLDTAGIGFAAKANINGYSWSQQGAAKGVTVNLDGDILCNPTSDGNHGINTSHPFGNAWDYGYYTMEFAINSDKRCAIHLLDIGDSKRVGFGLGANTERKMQADGVTPVVDDYHYYGQNFAYGGNMNDSATYSKFANINSAGAQFIAHETKAQRVLTGNKINVKIEFNCVDKVITMYEKTSEGWVKVASLDYSKVTSSTVIKPIFSLHVWDTGANVVIKNLKYVKGLSMTHFVKYSAGEISSKDYYGARESDMNAFIEDYKEKYNLATKNISGWSADGTANPIDLEKLYAGISDEMYAVRDIKLTPLINYDEIAGGAILRGVRFTPVDENKFSVNFIAALGKDIKDYAYVGFDIVKVARESKGSKITKQDIVTISDSVSEKVKCGGTNINARIFGGKYLSTTTLSDQVAIKGSQIDYYVTPFVVRRDGTRVLTGTGCFTFVDGAYTPKATPLEIPQ